MFYSVVNYLTWPVVLVVAIVVVYRKLYTQFPFFLCYLFVVAGADVIRLLVHFFQSTLMPYFYTYWITEVFEVVLGFLVLYEVFLIRIFPRFNLTVFYRRLFPVIALVVLTIAAVIFFSAPSKGGSSVVALIGASTLALNFCQVAFLTLFGGLALYMSREVGRHELGIAVGFAAYGAVKLFVTSERAKHLYAAIKVDQVPNIAYLVAIGIWLFYLSKSDPAPEPVEMNDELLKQVDRVYGEIGPLLPPRRKKD